jgi:malate permease and related proteins
VLSSFGFLFFTVLLPILLLIGLGALLRRFRPLEMKTLSTLQVYLLVPAFLFVHVSESSLSFSQMARIAIVTLLSQLLLGALVVFVLIQRKTPRATLSSILLSSVVFNAGNFGIPVAVRAFGSDGGSVQALIVMCANLSLWGIGYGLSAAINGSGWHGIKSYFKLPMVYCLFAALALKITGIAVPEPISYTLKMLSNALVPLALLTLGAQLVGQWRTPRWKTIGPIVFVKLIAMPLITTLIVFLFHLWPWPGALLIVAAAGPTAVNTILLAIEEDGDVELAAECVLWTTILSAITVTLILTVVKSIGGTTLPTP